MKNVVWDEKKRCEEIYDAFFLAFYKKDELREIVYVRNWVNLVIKENLFKAATKNFLTLLSKWKMSR